MDALILAAGFGSRLETVSDGRPKCLLEIGGRPLIEHQLEALADAGVHRVLIVVGYQEQQIRERVGTRAEFIVNQHFAETNSLYSMWLARDWARGGFLMLNADVLFHPAVLDRLLAAKGSALAYDSTSSCGREQTKVVLERGRVVDLSKNLPLEEGMGENLGVLKFENGDGAALFAHAAAIVEADGQRQPQTDAILALAAKTQIEGVDVGGLPWIEIDVPYDLQEARQRVWPAIHRARWRKVFRRRRVRLLVALVVLVGLLALGAWLRPVSPGWQSVRPVAGTKLRLKTPTPKGSQRWWRLETGATLEVEVDGPTALRVEARLLWPANTPADTRAQCVLQVQFDAQAPRWESYDAAPDPEVTLKAATVGTRHRFKLDLPPGTHIVRVKLLASATPAALVRVRIPNEDPDD